MTNSLRHTSKRPCTPGRILVALGVLMIVIAVGGLATGVALLHAMQPSTEDREVRTALLRAVDMPRTTDVQVSVPAWVMVLGRVGGSLAGVDPEISDALGAFHSGQVGVYELTRSPGRAKLLALLRCADERLGNQDWTRAVTLLDEEQLVLVYLAEPGSGHGNRVDAWAIIVDHQALVMVSARARTQPLLKLASRALDESGFQLADAVRQGS